MSNEDLIKAYPHLKLAIRYRRFIFQIYGQPYLGSHDRDGFLKVAKNDLLALLNPIVHDDYQMAIIAFYKHGMYLNQKLPMILQRIEKVRKDFLKMHLAAIEYPDIFGEYLVDEFVEVEDQKEILKFLISQGVYNYFFSVVLALETARKRGGLRLVEENAILFKAKNGEKIDSVTEGAQIGLKWSGIKIQQRIEALYHVLVRRGFISKKTPLEDFKTIFADQPVDNRITWLKTSKQLLLFIDAFLDKEFLFLPNSFVKKRERAKLLSIKKARGKITEDEDKELRGLLHEVNHWLYPRIAACFKNKTNIAYSSDSLKHARNDMYNKLKFPKAVGEFAIMAGEIAKF